MQQALSFLVILLVVWSELTLTPDGAHIKLKRYRMRLRQRGRISCRKYPYAPRCLGVWNSKRSYPSFEDLQARNNIDSNTDTGSASSNALLNRVRESLAGATYPSFESSQYVPADVTTTIPLSTKVVENKMTSDDKKKLLSIILEKLRTREVQGNKIETAQEFSSEWRPGFDSNSMIDRK